MERYSVSILNRIKRHKAYLRELISNHEKYPSSTSPSVLIQEQRDVIESLSKEYRERLLMSKEERAKKYEKFLSAISEDEDLRDLDTDSHYANMRNDLKQIIKEIRS